MSSDLKLSKWHCLREASLVSKTTEPKAASTHGMIDMTLANTLTLVKEQYKMQLSGNNG